MATSRQAVVVWWQRKERIGGYLHWGKVNCLYTKSPSGSNLPVWYVISKSMLFGVQVTGNATFFLWSRMPTGGPLLSYFRWSFFFRGLNLTSPPSLVVCRQKSVFQKYISMLHFRLSFFFRVWVLLRPIRCCISDEVFFSSGIQY